MPRPTLSYLSPQPPRRLSVLAISAFVVSTHPIMFCISQTRPFWTGHPMEPIAKLFQIMPLPEFPLWPSLGLVLGVLAVVEIHTHGTTRHGMALAVLAIAISTFCLASMLLLIWIFSEASKKAAG